MKIFKIKSSLSYGRAQSKCLKSKSHKLRIGRGKILHLAHAIMKEEKAKHCWIMATGKRHVILDSVTTSTSKVKMSYVIKKIDSKIKCTILIKYNVRVFSHWCFYFLSLFWSKWLFFNNYVLIFIKLPFLTVCQ